MWPDDLYTPALVGGPEAEKIAQQRRAACDQRYNALTGVIDAYTDNSPDTFLEEGHTRDPDS